jgi:acyl carrier protein
VESLETELKQFIIDTLQLEDLTPSDIDASAPLLGTGLGLDSIDAMALTAGLRHSYGLALPLDGGEQSRQHLASVKALAALVALARARP